jgi:para-aminobenzoate synthetase component 1
VTDLNLFTIIPYKDHLIQLEKPVRALAYYKNHSVNLLTGLPAKDSLQNFFQECSEIKIDREFSKPRVMHLFYELSFLLNGKLDCVNEESIIAIDIEFSKSRKIDFEEFQKIELKRESWPDERKYKQAFDEGYAELLKGNCYQFNLTYPFHYSFDSKYTPGDFIFSLWRKNATRGGFGSATFIPSMEKLFFSNSPECLFQIKDRTLSSMPIKGTLKRSDGEDWKLLWKKLTNDKKSQAELFMITDLLRNDLSRIEKPLAKIVKEKYPKLVPGLIHQYSQIDVQLSGDVTLMKILESLFPGGSITGAPKMRVIDLLYKLEARERSFYCGSTVLLYKKMKSASINIRSAEISFHNDQRSLSYQAGGGITLLSDAEDEYKEMTYKHNSFIDALTL